MIDSCIITGAGSGIGRAVALRLAKRCPLLLVGRAASNEETRRLIHADGGKAELFPCDLEDFEANRAALAVGLAKHQGKRWGMVLAGSILDTPGAGLADYEKVWRTNVVGNLAILEAYLPSMLAARFGRVVFFAGGGAAYANPMFPAYALSKVATVRLVENLSATHPASSGLSFICLAPGAVDTPMLAKVMAAGAEVKTKTSISEPVDFIDRYLASDSTALSGRYLHVRDDWQAFDDGSKPLGKDQFYLRRIP